MSELQNDVVESEVLEVEADNTVENQDNGAELATASEAEHEVQPQVDEEAKKQEAIQKVINEKTFKAKQAEREAEELRQKLAEIEAEKQKQLAQQVQDIPPMPSEFDFDDIEQFNQAVRARDEALLRKAQFDAQQQAYFQQQELQQEQEAQAKQQKLQESLISYTQKAIELGIKQEELQVAGKTVEQYGLSDGLVLHILSDDSGALITKYLAANPQEGFELAKMNPYMAGTYLNNIKEKASALKPKTTKAPEPATRIEGGGADPEMGKYKFISGAKFE